MPPNVYRRPRTAGDPATLARRLGVPVAALRIEIKRLDIAIQRAKDLRARWKDMPSQRRDIKTAKRRIDAAYAVLHLVPEELIHDPAIITRLEDDLRAYSLSLVDDVFGDPDAISTLDARRLPDPRGLCSRLLSNAFLASYRATHDDSPTFTVRSEENPPRYTGTFPAYVETLAPVLGMSKPDVIGICRAFDRARRRGNTRPPK